MFTVAYEKKDGSFDYTPKTRIQCIYTFFFHHLYQLKHEISRYVQGSTPWCTIVMSWLYTYTGDNQLAKTRGLSPRTGGQAMV